MTPRDPRVTPASRRARVRGRRHTARWITDILPGDPAVEPSGEHGGTVDEGWALGLGWLVFLALLAVLVWFVLRERE